MTCHQPRSLWTRILAPTLVILLFGGAQSATADEGDGLRVTDYFISHTSNEPFYAQQKLDPNVTLHVREVVLAGRERTVTKDGKVLLLIHGATVPGYVAFDTDYENASLMRYFARAGWDTFALDLEGYGLSTRPLVMDDPAAFPGSKAPMHGDVTVRDVERVVEFIGALRRVDKVHLLGWSTGADLEAPLYTIRHPDKVARLVLFGVGYDDPTSMDERKTGSWRRGGKGLVQPPLLSGALGWLRDQRRVCSPRCLRGLSQSAPGFRSEIGRTWWCCALARGTIGRPGPVKTIF